MPDHEITVLVVEDEESFVDALTVGLRREGFLVVVARNGEEAVPMFDRYRPDVVLLDVMLPGKSGFDVCREIRVKSKTPIIMVTAKTAEIDTVVGLEVGADDYITKPYRLRELVARIRAVLRRSPAEPAAVRDSDELVQIGEIRLDSASHELTVRGASIPVPPKEFELLELLMHNAGRVTTRDLLIGRIWGPHYVGDTKTLDVHIKRLRSRIETDPADPQLILTVRGLGYKYVRL